MTSLPILGAALGVHELEMHRDWLLELPRDIELQTFTRIEHLNADVTPLVDKAKSLLDGHTGRLGIHGPFRGFSIASPDPDIQAVVNKRFHKALDICAALGADQIVIHSPYSPWASNRLHTQLIYRSRPHALFDNDIEHCHRTMKDAVKRAEDMGCVFVIENVEDSHPRDRQMLVESFASPAVAVSLDTGHAQYARTSSGAPPIDFFVAEAGDLLHHVHLQDVDGYADRHWSLGDGIIEWRPLFLALASLQSNPRLIIELKDKSKIRQSANHLIEMGLAQ